MKLVDRFCTVAMFHAPDTELVFMPGGLASLSIIVSYAS